MRSVSLMDEESQRRLRPTDVVKMDRNCVISVIQVICFVLSTNSIWLRKVDGELYAWNISSLWHHNMLIIVKLVMQELAPVVNEQFFD